MAEKESEALSLGDEVARLKAVAVVMSKEVGEQRRIVSERDRTISELQSEEHRLGRELK